MKNFGLGASLIVGAVVILIGMAVLNGFMLSYMWQWFVVPLGVPGIRIPQATGMAVLVSMLTYNAKKSEKEDDPFGSVFTAIAAKLVAFAIAFGISFMVPA